jgi:hypothetical protein
LRENFDKRKLKGSGSQNFVAPVPTYRGYKKRKEVLVEGKGAKTLGHILIQYIV